MDEPTPAEPAFTIVRGQPDHDELAALTAVLLAKLRTTPASDEEENTTPRALWGAPRRPRPRVDWTAPH